MSLIRVQKNKDNPYVILNKGFLENPNISLKLKGFLAYCLSKPDDWNFHVNQLATVLKEGKHSLYSIINEGIEHGYIERVQILSRTKIAEEKTQCRFEAVDYVIHETPIDKKSLELKKCLPHSGFQEAGIQVAGNQTLLSNDTELCIDKNNNTLPSSPPQDESIKPKENVDVDLKKQFEKGLKQPKLVERAIKYLEENRQAIEMKARNVIGYVIDAVKNGRDLIKNPLMNNEERFRVWAKDLVAYYGDKFKIEMGTESLIFICAGAIPQIYIDFKDPNFEEKVLDRFRKMGVQV